MARFQIEIFSRYVPQQCHLGHGISNLQKNIENKVPPNLKLTKQDIFKSCLSIRLLKDYF